MRINTYKPSQALSPFIRSYLIIESMVEMLNLVLPDTSMTMAFQLKGQVDYVTEGVMAAVPAVCIAGLQRSARKIHYRKETATLIVVFREGGAGAFFPDPLHEIFNQTIALDNLTGRQTACLIEERLKEAPDDSQRITAVEQFLVSRLSAFHRDDAVAETLRKIQLANGHIRMNTLREGLYMSTDVFEKRFRRVVGTTAKQYARIVRMKSAIREQKHNGRLTDIALNSGYFDQPHFNKEFKLFTGLTPTDFFAAEAAW